MDRNSSRSNLFDVNNLNSNEEDFIKFGDKYINRSNIKINQNDFSKCNQKSIIKRKKIQKENKYFECEICFKIFNLKGNLKTHMRTHTGERPFKCNYNECESAFRASGQLTEHQRIHFIIKPFKCELCFTRFSRLSVLKAHLKSNFHALEIKTEFLHFNNKDAKYSIYHPHELVIESDFFSFLSNGESQQSTFALVEENTKCEYLFEASLRTSECYFFDNEEF